MDEAQLLVFEDAGTCENCMEGGAGGQWTRTSHIDAAELDIAIEWLLSRLCLEAGPNKSYNLYAGVNGKPAQ